MANALLRRMLRSPHVLADWNDASVIPVGARVAMEAVTNLIAESDTPGVFSVSPEKLRFRTLAGYVTSYLGSTNGEAEVTGYLNSLISAGLLVHDPEENSLALPAFMRENARRAHVNRMNGLLGGRRRKDDTDESYRKRREEAAAKAANGASATEPRQGVIRLLSLVPAGNRATKSVTETSTKPSTETPTEIGARSVVNSDTAVPSPAAAAAASDLRDSRTSAAAAAAGFTAREGAGTSPATEIPTEREANPATESSTETPSISATEPATNQPVQIVDGSPEERGAATRLTALVTRLNPLIPAHRRGRVFPEMLKCLRVGYTEDQVASLARAKEGKVKDSAFFLEVLRRDGPPPPRPSPTDNPAADTEPPEQVARRQYVLAHPVWGKLDIEKRVHIAWIIQIHDEKTGERRQSLLRDRFAKDPRLFELVASERPELWDLIGERAPSEGKRASG